MQEQEVAWTDATNDSDLGAVRSVDDALEKVDERMLCDIQSLADRLVAKADMLLGNFATNLCEGWMHIRSKFDGGKQINRIQSGSWQGRCAGAGLRQNLGPEWSTQAWKDATGSEPNDVLSQVSQTLRKETNHSRETKSTSKAKEARNWRKSLSRVDNTDLARRSYSRCDGGRNADDVSGELPSTYLQDTMLQYYKANVSITRAKAKDIEVMTRQQGTSECSANIWLAERRKRITASNVGTIAKRRSSTKVANTVKQLLYTTFRGNAATRWGTLQEPVSRTRYIQPKSSVSSIKDSGLVVSSDYPWLAASPDGLVEDSQYSPQ